MKNLLGQRFGRLSVVALEPHRRFGEAVWRCACDCGGNISTVGSSLRLERTRSCGCIKSETTSIRNKSHGLRAHPEYGPWKAMIYRCTKPNNSAFHHYGGRGIRVCDRWLNSLADFISDMGRRPPGYEIDRIDNNGDYEPANCRWASRKTQMSNTRSNHRLTIHGETKTLSDWARKSGKRVGVLVYRLQAGWDVEKAVFSPLIATGRRRRVA